MQPKHNMILLKLDVFFLNWIRLRVQAEIEFDMFSFTQQESDDNVFENVFHTSAFPETLQYANNISFLVFSKVVSEA